jgi:hypothetical protein
VEKKRELKFSRSLAKHEAPFCSVKMIIITLLFRWMFIGRWQKPSKRFCFRVKFLFAHVFWNFFSLRSKKKIVARKKRRKKYHRRLRHNGEKYSYLWIIYVINFGIIVCRGKWPEDSSEASVANKMLTFLKPCGWKPTLNCCIFLFGFCSRLNTEPFNECHLICFHLKLAMRKKEKLKGFLKSDLI